MIYVISKSTFGSYNVRDIQCNANWDCCPYSDYALIPDSLVDGILATQGYCDITLNGSGTEVVSFTARAIPPAPKECRGVTGAATYPKAVSGEVITADDSIAAPLPSLTLYGKTTQDGTPTPENPVELVSTGNGGAINTTVCGKNLIDFSKITVGYEMQNQHGVITAKSNWYVTDWIPVEPSTTYAISGTSSFYRAEVDDNYVPTSSSGTRWQVFTTAANARFVRFNSSVDGHSTPQLEKSEVVTEYEPYKGQTLTASTPGGLNSIGDIKDKIDFARGVYGRRIGIAVYDGSDDEEWQVLTTRSGSKRFLIQIPTSKPVDSAKVANLLNSQFLPVSADSIYANDALGCAINQNSGLIVHTPQIQTLDALKAHLENKPMTVAYELATPIETPLSAEELAQYAALHTNKPYTTVYNDAGAYMDAEYHATNAAVPVEAGAANEGKFLRVVNGAAAWVTVNSAEGGSF